MAKPKLSMRERYRLLTRDLDWTPTYVDPKDVYPYTRYEGIKIHDWDAWEDPFRLTIDSYCKYQAEKDKKLYAVIDSFAQGQGHLSLTDARYVNSLKLFLQGVTPLEYAAHGISRSCPDTWTDPVPALRRCARASTSYVTPRPRSTRSASTTSTTEACTTGRRCTTGSGISACPSRSSRTGCRRAR